MIPELSAEALRDELASSNPPRILDVREVEELGISRLDELVHVPMDQLHVKMAGLDKEADWVVVCRSGKRSGMVTQFLLASGFKKVRNLEGGMNAWATKVDRTKLVY
ncbi:rhodanese-like domain-containing protein [bacterium]|nr:MAG: rhodanese-like domain-containing protein [bacterium]